MDLPNAINEKSIEQFIRITIKKLEEKESNELDSLLQLKG